jgi:phospholipase/carboxylesterase
MITRRGFLALASTALPLTCAQNVSRNNGRLHVTAHKPALAIEPGTHALSLGSDRDGILIVPKAYRADTPAPLAVMLHGAGGFARRVAALFSVADELGIIVLATDSRAGTWDAIRGGFGPDIDFLDRALEYTFTRCAVDPRRLAIGGFSDGATYGLSVGLINGKLFTHILACSPGFIIPGPFGGGRPKIFISHGTSDEILPINVTSRRIVPMLENEGYSVTYREFDGPHRVPPEIAKEALSWLRGK